MVVGMLKNRSSRYSSHYIIEFVGFVSIYYALNLNIVSSCMVLTICILDPSIYCKFEPIILFFLLKK